jgi:hypothetical protein
MPVFATFEQNSFYGACPNGARLASCKPACCSPT